MAVIGFRKGTTIMIKLVEPQFNYQYDALNIRGHNPEQKVTSALRILGCDRPPDSNDEYLRIGSQNDINVLHKSPLFEDLKYGISPRVNFSINGNQYTHGNYLADGVYPKWSTLVQCYRQSPSGEMGRSYSYFNSRQMDLRKDVERAFGILKRKVATICGPYRGLSAREMHKTMLTCIIMHNMEIQETRRNKNWTNHQDEDLRPEIIPARGLPARNYAQMTSHIENITLYNRLREDLRANMWAEFGRDGGQIE
ncbi:uncharacterized protein LOC113296508 [Papaver somniferum]|uniref:uncharacterized protein LOC113296508 n=1 Tax=Papaver somniferum TaxID=3469 RepID=UPI000E6FD946|nr:uncharacterized protein LOC113296508 [Papaver somniferum]